MKKAMLIAMSGGVDSSVAANLAVNKGYDCTGVMLKRWYSSPITVAVVTNPVVQKMLLPMPGRWLHD